MVILRETPSTCSNETVMRKRDYKRERQCVCACESVWVCKGVSVFVCVCVLYVCERASILVQMSEDE